jgi:hypothetical protein
MSKMIEQSVREKYGALAASGLCGEDRGVRALAEAYLFTGSLSPTVARRTRPA